MLDHATSRSNSTFMLLLAVSGCSVRPVGMFLVLFLPRRVNVRRDIAHRHVAVRIADRRVGRR